MSRFAHLPEGTLLVGTFRTVCNGCGRECSLYEASHQTILGYGPDNGDPGCGVLFTHIISSYMGAEMEAATRRLRPDLEYIGVDVAWRLPRPEGP